MTVTKGSIVKAVMENVRFRKTKRERQRYLFPEFDCEIMTKKRAAELVDSLFEITKRALERDEDVLISGFGRFKVRFRWARKGRHPITGEQIIVNSRRIVTFHASPRLKEKMSKGILNS